MDASKEVLDSQRDLVGKMQSAREFQVVPPERARIVLTVIGRGKGSEAFGAMVSTLSNGTVLAAPMAVTNYWVLAVLTVGTYQRAFQCDVNDMWRTSPWGDCAGQIVEDVRAWARANAAPLQQQLSGSAGVD